MGAQPQTWHFGLVADWWAEFNVAGPEELQFYQEIIEHNGQPALDLGCGAGHLLLPLLRAGLDVDGCDLSPDMLARCRDLADRDGLTPRLYPQAMHALDLPRSYRTIYICDSFGIGGERGQDAEALRRCYQSLAPGGMLVFNHYLLCRHARRACWCGVARRPVAPLRCRVGVARTPAPARRSTSPAPQEVRPWNCCAPSSPPMPTPWPGWGRWRRSARPTSP